MDSITQREEYTFTFDPAEEKRFRQIIERLDPDEFSIIQDIGPVDPEKGKYSKLSTIMTMEPEAASTFRFGMKDLKIKRKRTEEEEAALKEREEKNKITIRVIVPPTE